MGVKVYRVSQQRWLIKQLNESVCFKWINLIPQCQYKGPPVCDVCGDVRALSESFKNEDFILPWESWVMIPCQY